MSLKELAPYLRTHQMSLKGYEKTPIAPCYRKENPRTGRKNHEASLVNVMKAILAQRYDQQRKQRHVIGFPPAEYAIKFRPRSHPIRKRNLI